MLKNVGLIDRIVRFVLFLGFAIYGLLNISTGLWWVGLFGLIPLTTGLAGYCPVWHALNIKTVSVKKL